MIAPEIVRHDVVLDDVPVAVRRDDSLADRVVPARDVRDNRELESTRRGEVRHDALRLHVGDDERSTVRAHRLEEPPRNVPAWTEEPPLHRALHAVGPRQPPLAGRVEHPVRVAGLHTVGVEAVAPVQPDRERVVAELPVQRRVHTPQRAFAEASRARRELGSAQSGCLAEAVRPRARVVCGNEEYARNRPVEPLSQPVDDPGVEEDPDREQIGKDDPDASCRHGTRTRARAAMRSASDAPSRP